MAKNPLDDMVNDLVVFKHENPASPEEKYFSNNPLWSDSRIRERWLELHSDEAVQQDAGDDEVDDGDEEEDYESWTNEQLRGELAGRNLSVDGRKADLIARLVEDDNKED